MLAVYQRAAGVGVPSTVAPATDVDAVRVKSVSTGSLS
jgi:hypothetical protein